MKLLKILLLLFSLTLVGIVLILGYLGFIPAVASIFGSDLPRDLGVKYSEKDYTNYVTKSGQKISKIESAVNPSESIQYSGKKEIEESFSQEEISARINYSKWKYMPISNAQIRINADGSVEFSGLIIADRLEGFVAREGAGQYSMEDVNKGLNYARIFGKNFPIYAKFKASINNNTLNKTLEKIEVGRFSIPLGAVKAEDVVKSVALNIINRVPEFYAEKVTFENGKMNFKGTIPQEVRMEFAN